MSGYSAFSILRHALGGHRRWPEAIPDHSPRKSYDVVIVGAGGHGLATAYYLAKNHGITNVAVVDKGWLGRGNITRNTAIVRSNYFLDCRGNLAETSLKLWEGLGQELNFNIMFSQRGILNLAHSTGQLDDFARRANAMAVRGVYAELLSPKQIQEKVPLLDLSPSARYPVQGGLFQPRGGVIRHDAVAWGYARAAAARGVQIVQHCEVTGFQKNGNRIEGVETTRGPIAAERVALAVSAGTSPLARMAGIIMPLENHNLQACVTEPLKPALDMIVTHGLMNFYVSQTDKGELLMGGNIDGYNTWSSFGPPAPLEEVARACLSLFPSFGRLRILRTWGGVVEMSIDGSPIVSKTPLEGLYITAGWCYGGFKTIPGAAYGLAEMMAKDETPELLKPFALSRFESGRIVPEEGHGNKPWKYH